MAVAAEMFALVGLLFLVGTNAATVTDKPIGACTHMCAKLYAEVDRAQWDSPSRDRLTGVVARNLRTCTEECDARFHSFMAEEGGQERLSEHLKKLSYESFEA